MNESAQRKHAEHAKEVSLLVSQHEKSLSLKQKQYITALHSKDSQHQEVLQAETTLLKESKAAEQRTLELLQAAVAEDELKRVDTLEVVDGLKMRVDKLLSKNESLDKAASGAAGKDETIASLSKQLTQANSELLSSKKSLEDSQLQTQNQVAAVKSIKVALTLKEEGLRKSHKHEMAQRDKDNDIKMQQHAQQCEQHQQALDELRQTSTAAEAALKSQYEALLLQKQKQHELVLISINSAKDTLVAQQQEQHEQALTRQYKEHQHAIAANEEGHTQQLVHLRQENSSAAQKHTDVLLAKEAEYTKLVEWKAANEAEHSQALDDLAQKATTDLKKMQEQHDVEQRRAAQAAEAVLLAKDEEHTTALQQKDMALAEKICAGAQSAVAAVRHLVQEKQEELQQAARVAESVLLAKEASHAKALSDVRSSAAQNLKQVREERQESNRVKQLQLEKAEESAEEKVEALRVKQQEQQEQARQAAEAVLLAKEAEYAKEIETKEIETKEMQCAKVLEDATQSAAAGQESAKEAHASELKTLAVVHPVKQTDEQAKTAENLEAEQAADEERCDEERCDEDMPAYDGGDEGRGDELEDQMEASSDRANVGSKYVVAFGGQHRNKYVRQYRRRSTPSSSAATSSEQLCSKRKVGARNWGLILACCSLRIPPALTRLTLIANGV
jgi:hypothetical protein